MTAKKILKNKWLTYGRLGGFGIGFSVNRHYISLDLAFWYVGLEY